MGIAIVLIVLALGSVLFYVLSPWHLTPLASNWGAMDNTILITAIVTGVVFLAVNGFMAWAIFTYRHRRNRRAHYEPENRRLEGWLTGLTAVAIAVLLAPGLLVWQTFVTVPDDARTMEVLGQQWHWRFRFPGEDGELGSADAGFVSDDNPYGLDPDDPRSRDDVLVNSPRVMLPVDQPVHALLRSRDVIHNFQVAQFRAKMDLVPGQVSYLWFTPTRTGDFEILCAELCGMAHFAMRGMVSVVEPGAFEDWLAKQPTFGEIRARPAGDPERGKQLYATCASCHGPKGGGNRELGAPKLTGLGDWYLTRQLENFREGARGTAAGDEAGQRMRPFANQLAGRKAMADITAYLETLPDKPAPVTVTGNAADGLSTYQSTCASCHGAGGQGEKAYNAPRLAGMSDWYLVRQLEHFRSGVRGGPPHDLYGEQMAAMARTLGGPEAVRDVVAYINTLPVPDGQVASGPDTGQE